MMAYASKYLKSATLFHFFSLIDFDLPPLKTKHIWFSDVFMGNHRGEMR